MIHRLRWPVASDPALEFCAERPARDGVKLDESPGDQPSLAFSDPKRLGLEPGVVETDDASLGQAVDAIPPQPAVQGFDGVRACSRWPSGEERLLTEQLPFTTIRPGSYEIAGGRRVFLDALNTWPASSLPAAERPC